MASSRMIFKVPEIVDQVTEIIEEHGGQLGYDIDDVNAYLSTRAGEYLTVEFDDLDAPVDPIYHLALELHKHSCSYFGACDSHEDRSRAERYEAYLVYNLSGDKLSLFQHNFPWSRGEPKLDERSLRIAGVSETQIQKIVETFYPDPIAPKPL